MLEDWLKLKYIGESTFNRQVLVDGNMENIYMLHIDWALRQGDVFYIMSEEWEKFKENLKKNGFELTKWEISIEYDYCVFDIYVTKKQD